MCGPTKCLYGGHANKIVRGVNNNSVNFSNLSYKKLNTML